MGGAEDTEKSHFIYQILFFQQVLPAEELKSWTLEIRTSLYHEGNCIRYRLVRDSDHSEARQQLLLSDRTAFNKPSVNDQQNTHQVSDTTVSILSVLSLFWFPSVSFLFPQLFTQLSFLYLTR